MNLSIKLEKKLISDYPKLYQQYNSDTKNIFWRFQCGDGWFNIIEDLSKKIEYFNASIFRIKSKFGGLRIYFNIDDIDDIKNFNELQRFIDLAEIESYKTCEKCGAETKIDKEDGWFITLCSNCRKEKEWKQWKQWKRLEN